MEFMSISTSCLAAGNAVVQTSPALRLFIREVREARPELDAVLAEIHSLDGVLDILKDDAASFPADLARRTPPLLKHCTAIIKQIEGYMHVCNGAGLTAREKKFRWLAIKGDMVKLRLTLEGYKSILAVVTDLVALTRKSEPTNDAISLASGSESRLSATREGEEGGEGGRGRGHGHGHGRDAGGNQEDMQHELTHVMADMGSLRGRLQGDFRSNYAVSDLESYLDAMLLQATNLSYQIGREKGNMDDNDNNSHRDTLEENDQQQHGFSFLLDDGEQEPPKTPQIPRRAARRREDLRNMDKNASPRSNSSSLGDEPDSAIDMNDSSSLPYHRSPREASLRSSERDHHDRDLTAFQATSSPSPPSVVHPPLPIVEIDEFLDELNSDPATRAPTPPPRARARNNSLALRDASSSAAHDAAQHQDNENLSHSENAPDNASSVTGALTIPRPSSVARSLSEYSTALQETEETNSLAPGRRNSYQRSYAINDNDDADDADGDAVSTLGDLMGIRRPFRQRDQLPASSALSFSSSYSTSAPALRGYDDIPRSQGILTTSIEGEPAAITTNTAYPPRKSSITRNSIITSTSSPLVHGAASTCPPPPPPPSLPTTTTKSSRPPSSHASRLGRSSSRLFGRKSSFSVPARPSRPASTNGLRDQARVPNNALPPSATTTALPFRHHGPNPSIDTTNTLLTSHSSSSSAAYRPSTSTTIPSAAGSIRSTGSRLSTVFSRVSFWRSRNSSSSHTAGGLPGNAILLDEDVEPDDIFGVSLKKSMQIASASVRTHHDGSKSSSRRDFPRCILVCVSFIKNNGGVRAPNLFGGDYTVGGGRSSSSLIRVAALKEAFSTAPHYGEGNIDWAAHDVYDAAELIVLFLQQLRKPLVTETVAKRWIVMSKQATLPGSMGLRLDSCIDFWDEALLGIRGAARSLFKLLLNLWGDVADAAELNDMTAERLAARLLNPLMHLPAGKYTTDFMLGLAFLIRKRSEYAIMLREGRRSHAAF